MAKKARIWDGSQWVDIASAVTDLTQYANLTTTPVSGFRNAIINGDFRINQRGFTSNTTNATYTFDRWAQYNSGGTVTTSAQTFTVGSPAVSGFESANYIRQVVSGQSTSGHYGSLLQPIEDVRTYAGATVTISFYARAGSGTPKIAVELQQKFGSGGSPSSDVFTYTNQVTLSTSWARYSITTAVPSISGKTIGTTANTSSLGINLWTSAGSDSNTRSGSLGVQNNTFDIWGVQVEPGTIATPFEQRPIGAEIALCQRYFCKSFPIDIAPANNLGTGPPGGGNQLTIFNTTVGNSYSNFQRFPVPMRRAPDMVAFNSENANAGSWSIYNSAGALNSSYATTAAFSPHHTGFLVAYGGLTTVTVANGAWTASAEL